MTFEEHLENYRREDGSYDLAGAEQARAQELADDPGEIDRLAAKAAASERGTWERQNAKRLSKQLSQPALSPALELEAMVQIGDSTVVRYGDMNHVRIQMRKDLRTKVHLDEGRAFDAEITHWLQTEQLLDPGETIGGAMGRTS